MALVVLGCAARQPPQPDVAAESGPDPAAPPSTASSPPDPSERAGVRLTGLPPSVPAPSPSCPTAGALPSQDPCAAALSQLADALELPPEDQDAALAPLETCADFAPGVIRVLRAERAPRCADALVLSVVGEEAAGGQGESPWIRTTLVGLGLAARLRRTVADPPEAPDAESRAELEEYFARDLFPWATEQSTAIHHMATLGSELSGYAHGVVAIEAGMADMRFVEVARDVPIPPEMRDDPEVAEVYYSSLDEALEPRKARGRDAALVGLAELYRVGVVASHRLDAARELIGRVYAGHRMQALDDLLVPEAPGCARATAEERIAATVESPHAAALLPKEPPSPALSACLLERGLPLALERQLSTSTNPEDLVLLGRGAFELGRTYFIRDRFQDAEAAFTRALDAETGAFSAQRARDARFLRALSVALSAGPGGPVDLFHYGSRLPRPLGDLTLLDALGTSDALGARATFDGALLRELAPEEGSPEFWKDLARRYERAAQGLSSSESEEAQARAEAARQTARTLEMRLK